VASRAFYNIRPGAATACTRNVVESAIADLLVHYAIQAKSHDELEETTELGLIKGHAYAVTAIRKVQLTGGGLFRQDYLDMVQLRNPWGPGIEWKGPFSDGSVLVLNLVVFLLFYLM